MSWEVKFYELSELDKSSAWDYVTALRGCDSTLATDDRLLKLFYTTPLRGVISIGETRMGQSEMETFMLCIDIKNEKILKEIIKSLNYYVAEAPDHYILHAMRGYEAIGEDKIAKAILRDGSTGDLDYNCIWEIIWRVNNFVRKNMIKRGVKLGI